MKKEFSKYWIASRQTRKQRKYRANAGFQIKHRMLASNLSEELRKKYSRRSFAIRIGDKVKIMSGEFKGKVGKISLISIKKSKVAIEGVQFTKKDGTKINSMFHCSNLQVQELNLEDKKRLESLQRSIKKPEEKETKK
jgi:large subunit ribosomal protein L24